MNSAEASSLHDGQSKTRVSPLLVLMLSLLYIGNVYDMGGSLGLKYSSFIAACCYVLLFRWQLNLNGRDIILGLFAFVVWPTWSLLLGILRGGDIRSAVSQVTPFLAGILLAFMLRRNSGTLALRVFHFVMLSLAIVVILLFVSVFLFPQVQIPMARTVFSYLANLGDKEGFFGTKVFYGAEAPNVYFRATLFFVPTFIYFTFTRRLLCAAIILAALALSFSKAGIFLALVSILLYPFFFRTSKDSTQASAPRKGGLRRNLASFLPVLALSSMLLAVYLSFPWFAEDFSETLKGESGTALVRKDDIQSVLQLFYEHPDYLLIGQGAGTSFALSGDVGNVYNIEVDHLNTIRKFGLPWFLLFSFLVYKCSLRLIKTKDLELTGVGVGLLMMYIAGGTNPVLLSPLFLMLLVASHFARKPSYGMPR